MYKNQHPSVLELHTLKQQAAAVAVERHTGTADTLIRSRIGLLIGSKRETADENDRFYL